MHSLLKRAKRDDGIAMVTAVGVIAVITVIAVGGFYLAQQSLHDSQRLHRENKAFQTASAGLDQELAAFDPARIDEGYYPRPPQSMIDGSTYVVNVARLGGDFEYVITSRGNANGTTETVAQRFFYLNLWDMNIGAGQSSPLGGGNGWNGNATIDGPLYVRGNMEWTSNAKYNGGPLLIRDGYLDVSGSGTLGEDRPIRLYATDRMRGNTGNVYLDGPISVSVPDITLPPVDDTYMDQMLARAQAESIDNKMGGTGSSVANTECVSGDPATYSTALFAGRMSANTLAGSTSQHYKSIGPASGRSVLGAGTTALTIGGSSFGAFERYGYPASSGLHDDFAFRPAGMLAPGESAILYLEGTVFVDGPVTIGTGSPGETINYVGNGTLVANGDINILCDLRPLTPWPSPHALGLVTPGAVSINPPSGYGLGYDPGMTGAIFCGGQFSLLGTHSGFEGTVLAGTLYGSSPNDYLRTNPSLKDILPESMPGAGGGLVFPGAWSRY